MKGFTVQGTIRYAEPPRMKPNSPAELYQKFYVDQRQERLGLFKAVSDRFASQTVLYPGCFLHISASYFFPHVVYVDLHAEAQKFFADLPAVLDFVQRSKQYPRSPYVRFIPQDFSLPLPLPEQSFDLLVSLYIRGAGQVCKKYLKPGGLLLTNNHQDDAGQAARDPEFELAAVVEEKGSAYRVIENDLTGYFVPRLTPSGKPYLQYGSSWPVYSRNASYYIFRRVSP